MCWRWWEVKVEVHCFLEGARVDGFAVDSESKIKEVNRHTKAANFPFENAKVVYISLEVIPSWAIIDEPYTATRIAVRLSLRGHFRLLTLTLRAIGIFASILPPFLVFLNSVLNYGLILWIFFLNLTLTAKWWRIMKNSEIMSRSSRKWPEFSKQYVFLCM